MSDLWYRTVRACCGGGAEVSDTWIRTGSGQFDIHRPVFDLNDIAHALSMTVRFGGHVSRFYSVAEHSVLVSMLMEKCALGDPLEGLLHDGVEAYLSDVPAPFKQLLPDWSRLEDFLDAELRKQFGIAGTKTFGCTYADTLALFIEANDLVTGRGADFPDPDSMRPLAVALGETLGGVRCWSPDTARNAFLLRYNDLTTKQEVETECV